MSDAYHMQNIQFIVSYDGTGLKEHEMDVKVFSQSLMALSDLFENANRSAFGSSEKPLLRIKANKAGSFEVQLILSIIPNVLTSPEFSSAVALKDLIFGENGLVGVIQWLRKRDIETFEKMPDRKECIILKDGEIKIVSPNISKLLKDKDTLKALKWFMSVLGHKDIETVEVKNKSGLKMNTVIKAELEHFKTPEVGALEEDLGTQETDTWLTIVSLSFEGGKWSVHCGTNKFLATMADDEFIRKIKNQKVAFAKGDMLFCNLSRHQYINKNGKQKSKYSILKVKQIRSGARQLNLID